MADEKKKVVRSKKEIDHEIDMAKEIVRECRKQTLIKLRQIVEVYKNKLGLLSNTAIDENIMISVIYQDTDTMKLKVMGQTVAVIDWVEMEIYPTTKEEGK